MALKKDVKPENSVPVFIPKLCKGDDARYIAVNGRRILVQTGKTVYLPKEFAEVVLNSQQQDEAAQAYIDSIST